MDFHFWWWKSHGKSMLKKRGHPVKRWWPLSACPVRRERKGIGNWNLARGSSLSWHESPVTSFHSAVALPCGRAHVQRRWERANFDPNDIKIPEMFQIWTWRPWLRPRVQIFISIDSAGLLPRWVKYYGFVTSWLLTYLVILYFSRARTQVEPVDVFSRFMAHTTCFRPRTEIIWGNSPKRGVNRQTGRIWKSRYLAKYKHDQRAILGVLGPSNTSRG